MRLLFACAVTKWWGIVALGLWLFCRRALEVLWSSRRPSHDTWTLWWRDYFGATSFIDCVRSSVRVQHILRNLKFCCSAGWANIGFLSSKEVYCRPSWLRAYQANWESLRSLLMSTHQKWRPSWSFVFQYRFPLMISNFEVPLILRFGYLPDTISKVSGNHRSNPSWRCYCWTSWFVKYFCSP